jgi:hypothetical protein
MKAFVPLIVYMVAVAVFSAIAFAQSPQARDKDTNKLPTPASQKIPIPRSAAKDAVYQATHRKDAADKAIAELNAKVIQFQSGAQQQFASLHAQQAEAQKEQDAADAALLKELNLDDGRHMINHETMEAMVKPEPVKAAEKKASMGASSVPQP